MKLLFAASFMCFLTFSAYAHAEKPCAEINFGSAGVAKGIYIETTWGDMPWTKVKQADGKEISFMCAEDEMQKHFGKIGKKVNVPLVTVQFPLHDSKTCYENTLRCDYKGAYHRTFTKKKQAAK